MVAAKRDNIQAYYSAKDVYKRQERLCALAQKGDATALDSLIDNNKSFIGKVANDLFRSMNLAQAGLNLDTDDLKQAGNLGLWKAVPKFDAACGRKFLT